jgi:SAM-dependent methyltransferase
VTPNSSRGELELHLRDLAKVIDRSVPVAQRTATHDEPSVLVAIASYGRKQDHFLAQVISEFRRLAFPCRVVVLSEAPKLVDGAEVVAGLPSSNPYSLPFAHRKLFAENVDKYDLFIYTEDDTLLTAVQLDAFLELHRHLKEDEILGFIRSETTPSGERYITSANHSFRWLPETAETRGGELFAQFSNQHSGCFIATQAQLRRALSSGGFLVEPHDERYGMLESAASDIYTQCGLRRLICVSRIHELIVPHLPNKYFKEMGIPLEELERQLRALSDVQKSGGWRGVLHQPQSHARGFRWSRNLYAKPDETLLNEVPPGTRQLLSIGAAAGEIEDTLRLRGIDVHAVAMDAVFAGALRAKGIKAVEGTLTESLRNLSGHMFDAILMADFLHLVEEPVEWMRSVRPFLSPGGCLVVRVDNTGELSSWVKDIWAGRGRSLFPNFTRTGVQPVSAGRLRRWCAESGFSVANIVPSMPAERRQKLGKLPSSLIEPLFASAFILTARRTE